MKLIKKTLLLCLLFIAGISYGQGANQGVIVGRVLDAETGDGLSYASVSLFMEGKSVIYKGVITKEKGRFAFRDIPFGKYYLAVDFVGYGRKTVSGIEITPAATFFRVGKILLEADAKTLNAVEVTGERELMELGLDKKVFNVEKNVTTAGGNATDVLRNLPSVSVDVDGNVSLRGSTNVKILINGKESGLTGSARQAQLDQIQAGMIKTVEIMTNPSAKYNPEGMSGIINIITKKRNKRGFFVDATASAGLPRDRYDASVNLNKRFGRWNFFTSFGGKTKDMVMEIFNVLHPLKPDDSYFYETRKLGNITRKGYNAGGGIEYFFSEKSSVILGVNYYPSEKDKDFQVAVKNFTVNYQPTGRETQTEAKVQKNDLIEYNLDFSKVFDKKGKSLSANAAYSVTTGNQDARIEKQLYDLPLDRLTDSDRYNELFADSYTHLRGQLDYAYPLSERYKIETGWKSVLKKIDNDYRWNDWDDDLGKYIPNDTISNHFLYDEQIHAGYGIFSGNLQKVDFQLGVRLEQTYTNSHLINDKDNKHQYFSFFPSGSVSYRFTREKKLQLSYSRRIHRPRLRALNPFPRHSDARSVHIGNPALNPEYIDSWELAYQQPYKKGTVNAAVFYKKIHDIIRHFSRVNNEGVRISTYENISSATSFGMELIATYRPFKWWNINASTSFYYTALDGSNIQSDLINTGYMSRTRFMSSWNIKRRWNFQTSGFYSSKGVAAQGNYDPMWSLDVAVKYSFWKRKGSLSLRASDIFDTRRFHYDAVTDDFTLIADYNRQSRAVYLTFAYSMSKKHKRKKGKHNGNGGEEVDF